MTITPRSQADYPEGLEPVDDSDWVRAVVSAALVQASIPEEQANRVLTAATSVPLEPKVTSALFSAPSKPPTGEWPELEAPAKVEVSKQRLNTLRSEPNDYFAGVPTVEELRERSEVVSAAEHAPEIEEIPKNSKLHPPAAKEAAPEVDSDELALNLFDAPATPEVESHALASVGVGNNSAAAPPTGQSTSRIPVLGSGGDATAIGLHDEVLTETDASVEGYRSSTLRTVVEWLVVIFLALVVAVLAKEFIVQAFWIPSESMETTVNVGDRVLVNKLSFEFNDVRRGDLVVFEKVEGTPSDTEDLIKRAVALPGETIEVRSDGRLWIWGPGETPEDALLLQEPYLDAQNSLLNAPSTTDAPSSTIWHETCVNDRSDGSRCTLDSESLYMMGDNRGRSFDSRGFGPVPQDNVIGRAFFRIWPLGAISTL